MMAMASVGLVQAGITNPANGIFIKPVTEAFGWSRSLFVGAISAGTLVGGGASLVMGPALDRYGPRWIVSIGLLVLGGALMALAFVENAWQFYIAMMVGRAVLQSSLMLSAQVVVPKWFVRQRGRAVAISGNASTLDTLGWIYVGRREYTIAIAELSRSIRLNPTDPVAYYHLGEAYRRNRQFIEASDVLNRGRAAVDGDGLEEVVKLIDVAIEKTGRQDDGF
ncbi:MAG: MFS transporter [Planctomycetes bacterium]|nr:MFS transporter [Planctomycetota bacterium]